jgi:hypothetical protein
MGPSSLPPHSLHVQESKAAQPTKAAHRLPFELNNFCFPLHGIRVNGGVMGAVGHQLPEPSLLFQLGFHLLPVNRERQGCGALGSATSP